MKKILTFALFFLFSLLTTGYTQQLMEVEVIGDSVKLVPASEELLDLENQRKNLKTRMTEKTTYLPDGDVLVEQSTTYTHEEFAKLLQRASDRLDSELKQIPTSIAKETVFWKSRSFLVSAFFMIFAPMMAYMAGKEKGRGEVK